MERLLLRDTTAVYLPPKAFDTLLLLVEHSGHLLTKAEMLRRLWPDTFVEEVNLAQNVSAVRRALGKQESGEDYIETVPKAGYRFAAETRSVARDIPAGEPAHTEQSPAIPAAERPWFRKPYSAGFRILAIAGVIALLACSWWLTRAPTGENIPAAARIRSIAVLPLVNLSADPTQEYFSDGLTDELITRVAQLRSLRVISRTSVMGYKHTLKKAPEIAAELRVDSILEGTVERSANRVRIRVQLIATPSDQHLWAESYDVETRDVLQLESDLARDIAQRIGRLKSPPAEQPARNRIVSPEAHEHYLKGRYRWNQRDEAGLRAGIWHFQRALDLDPVYPDAYAGLADSYLILANWGFIAPVDGYPRAAAAARKALELNDRLAQAHTSLAYATLLYDWDWPNAEAGFRRALELDPNYATAHHFYSVYLMASGRHSDAQAEIERAHELDPLSPIINSVVGWIYFQGRRYDNAAEQCQRTLEMNPDYLPGLLDLGTIYLARGENAKATALFQRARAIGGDTVPVLSHLARGYARSGNATGAKEILHRLETSTNTFISPWDLALVCAALGDTDGTLEYLERAADQRVGWIVLAGVDPRLDQVRSAPRFTRLLERIRRKMPIASQRTGSLPG